MWAAQAAPRGERLHSGAPLSLPSEARLKEVPKVFRQCRGGVAQEGG